MKKSRSPKWAQLKPLDEKAVGSLGDISKTPGGSIDEYFKNMSHLLKDYRVPGGCDLCNAEYTMLPDPELEGATRITIFHDDDCSVIN